MIIKRTDVLESKKNYVVIFPNNDLGSRAILETYKILQTSDRFKIFPSIRFEYFLTLLKSAEFIIGNSSAGVREAPYYGIPTINIGSRQANRVVLDSIINTTYETSEISASIKQLPTLRIKKTEVFGKGNSAEAFMASLELESFWTTHHQKQFKTL